MANVCTAAMSQVDECVAILTMYNYTFSSNSFCINQACMIFISHIILVLVEKCGELTRQSTYNYHMFLSTCFTSVQFNVIKKDVLQ